MNLLLPAILFLTSAVLSGGAVIQSRSGQFTAFGRSIDLRNPPPYSRESITLTPEALVVSAERVKASLLASLGIADHYQGRIQLALTAPAQSGDITVVSTLYQNGWQYHVAIPNPIQEEKAVRGLAHVILLEIANRNNRGRSAELPLWLTEGFTQYFLHANGPGCVLAPETYLVVSDLRRDPLKEARDYLRTNEAPSFLEISLPALDEIQGARQRLFQHASHLFLTELLKLQNGRERMNTFLAALPGKWNWQTVFYETYADDFKRPLDVEKWWSVVLIDARHSESQLTLAGAQSLEKLEELLKVRAQKRENESSLPSLAVYTFQEVIRGWDFEEQRAALRPRINQLSWLQLELNAEAGLVAQGYALALRNYLDKRENPAYHPSEKALGTARVDSTAAQRAILELDALDLRRAALSNAARLNQSTPPPGP